MSVQAPIRTGAPSVASELLNPVRGELLRVEAALRRHLWVDDERLRTMATHLLNGGGKRLRAALVLLSGMAAGGQVSDALVEVAASVELLHMATLVHDDMVDRSPVRRAVASVHVRWGDGAAVLLGDYLFAKGVGVLSALGDVRAVRVMADVVLRMSAGEIREMDGRWGLDAGEQEYFSRVEAKTGYFIGECCRLGALVADAPEALAAALERYGTAVGLSYQIVDDVLDLTASAETLGKPVGSDLRAGVVTLPVLYALDHSPQAGRLRAMLGRRRVRGAGVAYARALIEGCGGIAYAYERAEILASEAQSALLADVPPSAARSSLYALADHLIGRVR